MTPQPGTFGILRGEGHLSRLNQRIGDVPQGGISCFMSFGSKLLAGVTSSSLGLVGLGILDLSF